MSLGVIRLEPNDIANCLDAFVPLLRGQQDEPQIVLCLYVVRVDGQLILEFAGGVLILIGLLTRFVAFILAGEMAIAYFTAHAPDGFWPLQNHGELAVLYCFVFLFFVAAGAGPWSVDRLLKMA